MKVVSLSHLDISVDVRQRKFGQLMTKMGHEVIDVGKPIQAITDEPLIWTAKVDGREAYSLNLAQQGRVGQAIVEELKPDAIHCHTLEGLELLYGHLVSSGIFGLDVATTPDIQRPEYLQDIKVVYEAAELEQSRMLYHMTMGVMSMRNRHLHLFFKNGFIDRAFAVSPAIAGRMEDLYGLEAGSVGVVSNAPFMQHRQLGGTNLRELIDAKDDDIVVAFSGFANPIRLFYQAALACADLGWKFVMFTSPRQGSPGFEEAIHIVRRAGGHIMPLLPYPHPGTEFPHLLDYLADCDIGFNGTEVATFVNNEMALPNKFFEYAFAGLRIVTSPSIDPMALCHEYKLGRTYNNTVEGLKTSMKLCLEGKAEARHTDFINEWCYDNYESLFAEVYPSA
jgi:hypothetical protein